MDVGGEWNNATTVNTTTFSDAEYLQTHLGARYRSLVESVTLSVVYAIILVTGVVGTTGGHCTGDHHRCCRESGYLCRHCLELAHAHGHQLLPVQPCYLRHYHSSTWYDAIHSE